jgi:hypothetical protein
MDRSIDCGLEHLEGSGPDVVIGVDGFLSEGADLARHWAHLISPFAEPRVFALRWKSHSQSDLLKAVQEEAALLVLRHVLGFPPLLLVLLCHESSAGHRIVTTPATGLTVE